MTEYPLANHTHTFYACIKGFSDREQQQERQRRQRLQLHLQHELMRQEEFSRRMLQARLRRQSQARETLLGNATFASIAAGLARRSPPVGMGIVGVMWFIALRWSCRVATFSQIFKLANEQARHSAPLHGGRFPMQRTPESLVAMQNTRLLQNEVA